MDDNNDTPGSPRKKLKAHHSSIGAMDQSMIPEMPSTKAPHASIDSSGIEDRFDKEVQCGITEYVNSDLPGFTGILKKRYTDFLVNEILPNGQVIHLDNLKKPPNQTRLSQTASTPLQKENAQPKRHTTDAGDAVSAVQNDPPRFESTNLNELEHGSRQKTKVFMRHGPSTLNVVDDEQGPAVNETEHTFEQGVPGQPTVKTAGAEVGDADIHPQRDQKKKAPSQLAPKPADTIPLSQNGTTGSTTGGWQAYAKSNVKDDSNTISDEDRNLLMSYFGPETVEQTLALFQRIIGSPQRKAKDFETVTTGPIERDVRTEIHQAIRRIFSSRLETMTNDHGAMVVCAANLSSNRGAKPTNGRNNWNNKPQQPRGKADWALLGGDYLHFTIYKENRDTMEAISHLAKTLKLRPQLFQFAGTKDRRGITVQRASVYRTQVNKLIDAGRTLRHAKIGNFEYHPHGLQLGDLMGNEFVITLRDCQFNVDLESDFHARVEQATAATATAIEEFSKNGFINYYGLQRFGSFQTGTHMIGRSMLQGDFKTACDAILSFHPSALAAAQSDPNQEDLNISRDDVARASALHSFATTGRAHPALEDLPRKFSAEACLIRHLSRPDHHNDYLGALQTISRNLRLMYVHAYQSLVWNIAASARWKAHGNKVLVGDLVLVNEHLPPTALNEGHDDNHSQADKPLPSSSVDQDGEPIIAPDSSDRAFTSSDEIFTRARHVTEAEILSPNSKITIFDIVLPTPGYDILYPSSNASGNIYTEFMKSEEGGGLDPNDMRRKWKDVSLSGSYRKLLARSLGGGVEWEVKAYGAKGEDEQFVETDAERLEKGVAGGGRKERATAAASAGLSTTSAERVKGPREGATAPADIAMSTTGHVKERDELEKPLDADIMGTQAEPTDHGEAKEEQEVNDKIALVLTMRLGSSTYATMALRELMKKGGVRNWKGEFGGGR
ncbi:MAG: hypothetical protein Q9220_004306 [cf. Caloplaca sp. 1 TL-2023]